MGREDIFWAFIFGDAYTLGYTFTLPPPRKSWIDEFTPEILSGVNICDGRYCYSSKTEEVISVANELVSKGSIEPQSLANRFARELRITNSIRKYDLVTSEVVRLIRKGLSWEEAVKSALIKYNLPSSDPLYRVIPIALYFNNLEDVLFNSEKQAIATHLHPSSIEASIAYALSLHLAINRLDLYEVVNYLQSKLKYTDRMLLLGLKSIISIINKKPRDVSRILSNLDTAYSVLTTALFCFIKSELSFEKGFTCSVSLGGYISGRAIATLALIAAYKGFPPKYRSYLVMIENYGYLKTLLQELISNT